MIPINFRCSSTTGRALICFLSKILATSRTDVFGPTVITFLTMISLAFMSDSPLQITLLASKVADDFEQLDRRLRIKSHGLFVEKCDLRILEKVATCLSSTSTITLTTAEMRCTARSAPPQQ